MGKAKVPPKPKRKQKEVPPHISHLECSVCGEALAGEDGRGMVYQTRYHDRVCQYCFGSAADFLHILAPGLVLGSQMGQMGDEAFDHLFRLLSRTSHKARVRVRQHEERKHTPFVQDPRRAPDPRS